MTSAAISSAGVRLVRAPRTVPLYEDEAVAASSPRLVPGPWGVEVPLPFDRAEQDGTVQWLAARNRRKRTAAQQASRAPGGSAALTRAETHRLTASFLQSLIEIATGRRPRQQLRGRMTTETLLCVDVLADTARLCARDGNRLALGRVTASQPTPWAVEFAATLRTGPRNRAVAGRLEMQQSHWVCTALMLLGR